jgi:hypothetical protein
MKKITMMLLLAGSLLLGAACSQEEEVKAPSSPTATPDPVQAQRKRPNRQKTDAATAVVPTEASATGTPISTPIP